MAPSADTSSSSEPSSKPAGRSKPQQVDAAPAPPLVLVANTWLDDLTARTRARPIPWEGYQRADLVSAEELKMIKKVDRQPKNKVDAVLDLEGASYATLYLRLLAKLSRTDTLQQILVLVGDMLQDRDDRVALFKGAIPSSGSKDKAQGEAEGQYPYSPFIKLLDVQDDFVQLKAAQFLTLLLVAPSNGSTPSSASPPAPVVARLLSFLSVLINSQDGPIAPGQTHASEFAEGNGADVGIQCLEALLRSHQYRRTVWDDELARMGTLPAQGASTNGSEAESGDATPKDAPPPEHAQEQGLIRGLISILRNSVAPGAARGGSGAASPGTGALTPASGSGSGSRTPADKAGPQMQYQVGFCIWLLTFDEQIAAEINLKFGVVNVLADVARNAVKEKVVRVIVASFRNLIAKAPDANAPAMLGSKVLPLCASLLGRKWSDEEIDEDLTAVKEVLAERLKGMSTYDEYVSELSSGELAWDNPAHELDDFWKENGGKLLENDAENLKRLVQILKQSTTAVTLAVACNDIGQLVKFHESSKKRVDELGAKARIMDLMSYDDADVKFRALNTVSRLVSGSWR